MIKKDEIKISSHIDTKYKRLVVKGELRLRSQMQIPVDIKSDDELREAGKCCAWAAKEAIMDDMYHDLLEKHKEAIVLIRQICTPEQCELIESKLPLSYE